MRRSSGKYAADRLDVVLEAELRSPSGPNGQVGEAGDDGEPGQDVERHEDARARLVGLVVRIGGLAPGLAEERQVDAAGHVRRGHDRADEADDEHDRVAVVAADVPAGAGQDLVLRPEAGEREDAGQRAGADDERRVGARHVLPQPPMSSFMSKLCTEWRDRARPEEQAGLEEGVGEEVEERRRPGADAERHDHVAELADRRVGQHLLDVVLDEGERAAAERR